jgi:hypothetical protein
MYYSGLELAGDWKAVACMSPLPNQKTSRGNGGLIVRLFVYDSFLSLNEPRHTPGSGGREDRREPGSIKRDLQALQNRNCG